MRKLTFRLGHEHDDKDQKHDAPCRVPAESVLTRGGTLQTGKGEGEDRVEAPGRGGCEGHTDVADVRGESLSRVGEWNRAHVG